MPPSAVSSKVTRISPPSGENLIALESRLSVICVSARLSVRSTGRLSAVERRRSCRVFETCGETISMLALTTSSTVISIFLQRELLRLDARDVENIVHDIEQVLGAVVDIPSVFAGFLRL
jgi:hypothetical protein